MAVVNYYEVGRERLDLLRSRNAAISELVAMAGNALADVERRIPNAQQGEEVEMREHVPIFLNPGGRFLAEVRQWQETWRKAKSEVDALSVMAQTAAAQLRAQEDRYWLDADNQVRNEIAAKQEALRRDTERMAQIQIQHAAHPSGKGFDAIIKAGQGLGVLRSEIAAFEALRKTECERASRQRAGMPVS
jgi:hypothetical protein